ncbi:MAG: signal peptidase II [Planctomycetota bacterium]
MTEETAPQPAPGPTDVPAYRQRGALLVFGLAFALGLTADLLIKYISWQALYPSEPDVIFIGPRSIEAIPGYLNFTAVKNYGAALGIGQGMRWLFVIGSLFAIGLLAYFFAQSGNKRFFQLVLGLLLAGVAGNLYDRVVYGYVRDMFHAFPHRQWSEFWSSLPDTDVFPWVFNLADMFLCVGVAIVVIFHGVLAPKDEAKPEAVAA